MRDNFWKMVDRERRGKVIFYKETPIFSTQLNSWGLPQQRHLRICRLQWHSLSDFHSGPGYSFLAILLWARAFSLENSVQERSIFGNSCVETHKRPNWLWHLYIQFKSCDQSLDKPSFEFCNILRALQSCAMSVNSSMIL